jgi:hypothetical protein
MNKRYNQILVGILVIQIVVSVIVLWPRPTSAVESEPLFPALVNGNGASEIVALTITDNEGNTTTLRRVTGNWVLPDADDYPAQESKITALLEKIVVLDTSRLVTRTDASHKRLQVDEDDFMRRIEFETGDGTRHTLYLGSSPRYGATHFRLDAQSETFLTNEITTWDTNGTPSSWVDTTYLNIPQDQITKWTLENANGTFIFTKDEEGNWTMDGLAEDETLAETRVTAALRQAVFLNLTIPLGKENLATYGMDEPQAVATIETADQVVTLRVGAQDPDDNSYTVISSESPYYVQVSEFSVQNLVENTRDDFLEVPPTPTSEENIDSE